nr:hypothetical protein [uncultured Ruegeria sp.]
MPGPAHNADAIVDEGFELQAVRRFSQGLRSKDKIHLATFQHGAEFVDQPCTHLNDAVWVLADKSGHGAAEKTACNNGRRPYPEFSNRTLSRLIRQDAGLFFGKSDGLSIAGQPEA